MRKRKFFTILSIPLGISLALALAYVFYDTVRGYKESLSGPHEYRETNRDVNVMLVADSTFVHKNGKENWHSEAEFLLGMASKVFEHQIGLKLVVCDFVEWPEQSSLNLRTLDRFPKGRCDIKLGLTDIQLYKDDGSGKPIAGKAAYWEHLPTGVYDSAMITSKFNFYLDLLIAHEIAHLFGAEDLGETKAGLVMTRYWSKMGPKFDEDNWHILVRNKYKDFHKDKVFRRIYEYMRSSR